ncbi:Hypothetical protein FKW44_004685, partial [Caligus rogercresseyi]
PRRLGQAIYISGQLSQDITDESVSRHNFGGPGSTLNSGRAPRRIPSTRREIASSASKEELDVNKVRGIHKAYKDIFVRFYFCFAQIILCSTINGIRNTISAGSS